METLPTKRIMMTIESGQRVAIYRNLNKNCYSIKALDGENKGRVISYIEYETPFILTDVKFKVSQAGRDRVLAQKQKNVHAFIQGYFSYGVPNALYGFNITYDPYRQGYFYYKHSEKPIADGVSLFFSSKGIIEIKL